jgi:EAL domain-containing protein (putative c-di-GMP-specific phosphodiesterase class I)
VPLTYWVLDEALSQAAAWRAEGPGPLPVAVNVAIPALEADGLVRHVERRLAAHSLPPEALVVEVTEGAMADGRQAMATLAALRRLGVRVAIDDFGAGYSSPARLRDLPLDVLKIDRAFLAARGLKGEAILRAVVELGRSLGLPTVAEGVETAEQLGLLRRVGAGLAQGHLIARPMPAAEFAAWTRSWADGRLLGPCLDLLRRAGAESR